jgi:cytoskeleton protein RodZ
MDIGAELRAAREAKGMSLGTLAQRTRVQPRALAAIEINDLSAIPPRPFGRGFVRAYAAEVDLDPDRTVQNYFAQFPPTQPPPQPPRRRSSLTTAFDPPSQWTGLGSAVTILLLVVVVAIVIGRNDTSKDRVLAKSSNEARDAVGTAGKSPRASVPPAVLTSAPPASAGQAVEPTPPLRLAFSVTRACWVAATADGQRTIYRIVQSGEKVNVDAQRDIAVRFGDAGAVAWSINGRPGSALGDAGVVRDVTCRMPNAECQF